MFDSSEWETNLSQDLSSSKIGMFDSDSFYKLSNNVPSGDSVPYYQPEVETFDTGVFTVAQAGEVGFDYLFDGGAYSGELAIFNLDGIDKYQIGSQSYIREAAYRALQNSPEFGYIVISERNEVAKTSGSKKYEGDESAKAYQGIKTFSMLPGTEFGIMLVPNGTIEDILSGSENSGDKRPMFSISEANLNQAAQFANMVEHGGDSQGKLDGKTFGIEDLPTNGSGDNDFNDLVFHMTGLTEINNITTTASEEPLYVNTNVSSSLINLQNFHNGNNSIDTSSSIFAGINGQGWSTVILDTGINLNHPFFGSDNNGDGVSDRIVYSFDFADKDTNASDFNGHGTNVASIIASGDATYTGIAPSVNIIPLKVVSDNGSGNFGYAEQALQWVINNAAQYNIASVNMSLGDSKNWTTPQSLYGIDDELQKLAQMGVIVVSASGNNYYDFNSAQGVAYPGADPNSLSVGAVYDSNLGGSVEFKNGATSYSTGSDQIIPISQRSETLTTVFAPGAPITGAGIGDNSQDSNFLTTMYGTSQAAPHITGAAVLAQQLAVEKLGRRLSVNEFHNLLKSTGVTIIDGDNENDNVTNTGLSFPRVNILALGQAIVNLAA
jgi:hypothetical protein